ncbi:uncharacterized protein LOC110440520 [Mizuhopecten yessoensis]|uniref:Uncharacterized protein n=1 Tax=Mizuhopecten yessoensis TaxID=6573 RepID=A0A210PL02_MIZYE|nr:uncharacterized protein LOC110440520 [Mizuhopecten yessoensis]OWF37168.1 hypothetical protein KP79_PYT21315 [Mizuhopecten yessoensis]
MAYSRYGNLQELQSEKAAASLQGNTSYSTGNLLQSQVGIHPTGNVPLPKRGLKLQSPDVMLEKCKSPVIKTDADDDYANKDDDNSPRNPHKATASTNVYRGASVVPEFIPKVTTLGDVTMFDIDLKKDGDIGDVMSESKNDILKETAIKKDPPETRRRYRPIEPRAFLDAYDNFSDDDILSNSITIEFDLESPRNRNPGFVQRAFANFGRKTRKFGRYIRRKLRQTSVVLCGGSHVG